MQLFRNMRLELWLLLAAAAHARALKLCLWPEDADTIQKIHDSTAIWTGSRRYPDRTSRGGRG